MGPLLVLIGVITIVATLGIPEAVAGVVTAMGIAFGLWRLSLVLWPTKSCPRCDGMGSYGPFSLRKTCGRCEGSGRLSRMGAAE